MSHDAERIAREFVRVWTAGNLDVLDRLADPGIVVSYTHFPQPIEGVESFRSVLQQTFRHFPDLVTTPLTVLGRGDRAMVEWEYEGTHEWGEMFGVEPSGARVTVKGVAVYRVEGGRVVEERGVADVLGLMEQLGAGPGV